ncbi:glycosyltransferase family 2 protein [Mammaliicoccus sp. P-M55]|uniref:glycosyltransferase family 2 protein n=1 Tax=Mammaliicoccus sp. P-M55 TaxID=2898714 RepID=UPI001EFBB84D|nr:glycosyltransferase family 2 protein [Mammaliicoccus sp. P-M55]
MKVTIFTPTYNRRGTLPRLYDSLLSQTSKQFEWIIVDDGSTDDTEEYVKSLNTDLFDIKYIKQKNAGKHVATNVGMKNANGDIFTCLDSDDWFYDYTIEFIIEEFKSNKEMTGFIALDTYQDGSIVGEKLPEINFVNWVDLRYKHNVKGDKCYVFRTDVIKNMTFPQYGNSKHMPPSYQLFEYSRKFDFKLINKPLKYVEYLSDGLTYRIKKQYFMSAENYCEYRKFGHQSLPNIKEKIKNIILFDISWIHTGLKRKLQFKGITNKVLSVLLLLPSSVLYFYFKGRVR